MTLSSRGPLAEVVENSAIWAAYGDALGFMTELAHDKRHVRARVGAEEVRALTSWTRQIGGRFGVKVELPAGSYSDDTQLRLATARAIRSDGSFDVEAFSKVELPVWLSYSLGAGRGTKAAAAALANRKTGWSTNFFDVTGASYAGGGGNGAAMRIQPHVWAASYPRYRTCLADVVRNSVCTHGHPRGIAGAVLHAVALAGVMDTGEPSPPDSWGELLRAIEVIPEVIEEDRTLHLAWLPLWEKAHGVTTSECFAAVVDECKQDLITLSDHVANGVPQYDAAVRAIGAADPKSRGSATKTALLALLLAWWAARDDPETVLTVAVNTLDSDTDTIGTMAGALIGAAFKDGLVHPAHPPMDEQVIRSQARRLSEISSTGRADSDFPYPDLLRWAPPKNHADALGIWEGETSVAGLGKVRLMSEPIMSAGARPSQWQWAQFWFGQTVLIKRRTELPTLSAGSQPSSLRKTHARAVEDDSDRPAEGSEAPGRNRPIPESLTDDRMPAARRETSARPVPETSQGGLFPGPPPVEAPAKRRSLTLEAALEIAESREYAANTVGSLLLQLAEQDGGPDLAVAFAAVVAQSRKRDHRRGSRR